ncbi:hypothetical protein KI387_024762, partial [Taxus chinensis]
NLIITGNLSTKSFKSAVKKEFEMKDLGLMHYFWGIEVQQSEGEVFISKEKYASDVLKRFNMLNIKPTPTLVAIGLKLSKEDEGSFVDPTLLKKLVGSVMYLTATRPDI